MADNTIQDNKLQILGKLTASLIHEIRNPLSAIKLNTDLLMLMGKELPEEVLASVYGCSEAADRIQELIELILNFTRKNNNGEETCSLNQITENAVELVCASARSLNVLIIKDLESTIPLIYINKNKILQVFINLITNAIESIHDSGKVVIRTYVTKCDNHNVLVWEVEDNGIGIDDDCKEKIFNDFYTNKKKGTGLGLSVCRMLLKEYNAELNFSSIYGKGTKFYINFRLPADNGS